jgi:chromosome segregation ATPase
LKINEDPESGALKMRELESHVKQLVKNRDDYVKEAHRASTVHNSIHERVDMLQTETSVLRKRVVEMERQVRKRRYTEHLDDYMDGLSQDIAAAIINANGFKEASARLREQAALLLSEKQGLMDKMVVLERQLGNCL